MENGLGAAAISVRYKPILNFGKAHLVMVGNTASLSELTQRRHS